MMFPIHLNAEYILIIIIGVVGLLVQWRLKSVFTKYSKVMMAGGMTGREVAEKMLRDNNIYDVKVISTPGQLTDHYNPKDHTVNLSESVYNANTISAAAVAAHECGHAVQHARAYAPLEMRSMLVPVINISSMWSTWIIIGGILLIKTTPVLFWVGIGMVAMSAIFSLITLPVELNASSRAMEWLRSSHTLSGEGLLQARSALTWAASTYLVAALSAIATLLYYLSMARGRD